MKSYFVTPRAQFRLRRRMERLHVLLVVGRLAARRSVLQIDHSRYPD